MCIYCFYFTDEEADSGEFKKVPGKGLRERLNLILFNTKQIVLKKTKRDERKGKKKEERRKKGTEKRRTPSIL